MTNVKQPPNCHARENPQPNMATSSIITSTCPKDAPNGPWTLPQFLQKQHSRHQLHKYTTNLQRHTLRLWMVSLQEKPKEQTWSYTSSKNPNLLSRQRPLVATHHPTSHCTLNITWTTIICTRWLYIFTETFITSKNTSSDSSSEARFAQTSIPQTNPNHHRAPTTTPASASPHPPPIPPSNRKPSSSLESTKVIQKVI